MKDMNIMGSRIRSARQRHHVGVRELAGRLGVTGSAVSQWERGELDGSIQLRTIRKALDELGETLVVWSVTRSTALGLSRREDRVALELHRMVAHRIIDDPDGVLASVPANATSIRANLSGSVSNDALDEWVTLARERDIGELVATMLGTDERSLVMRQTSPFAGVLTDDERMLAIERARG